MTPWTGIATAAPCISKCHSQSSWYGCKACFRLQSNHSNVESVGEEQKQSLISRRQWTSFSVAYSWDLTATSMAMRTSCVQRRFRAGHRAC